MAVFGVPRSCQGRDICVVVGGKSGIRGVVYRARLCRGRRAMTSGQKKEVTINMLFGGGVWQCAGVGGGTASAMVDAA
jgi:hypothetical protein